MPIFSSCILEKIETVPVCRSYSPSPQSMLTSYEMRSQCNYIRLTLNGRGRIAALGTRIMVDLKKEGDMSTVVHLSTLDTISPNP